LPSKSTVAELKRFLGGLGRQEKGLPASGRHAFVPKEGGLEEIREGGGSFAWGAEQIKEKDEGQGKKLVF